ncbi:SET domain-containing protein [Fomitiporia mediterranea MF3/22]|uniref:SET domain-containing protein n=1 Tax=Fomitiporia mediterranea (strain MF3/22) TaxID=694068 RepID=UPI0004407D90|nr:SET domain-containing protein [Fomitiporia mediterranea MF3/22]EJD05468.1 SET domain-containing protein [Fomitiporia mediterranea MF3/22]
MSFRDIHVSRASRKPRSFVVAEPAPILGDEPNVQEALQPQSQTQAGNTCNENTTKEAQSTYVCDEEDPTLVTVPSGLYAQLPPILSVKRSKERGRGMWTSGMVPAGTVLCSVKPHVHALSRSQLHLYCTSCCAPQPSVGLKKCTKCKAIHYCGTTCQNADWQFHKLECEALQRWSVSAPPESDDAKYAVPPEAVRCLARTIWRRKKLGSGSIWWREINEMQSKREGVAQSMIDAHVHLAHATVRYMGISGQEELKAHGVHSISELVDLISKFTLNSYTLTTPSLSPIGVSVSPLAGLLNHSCDPNVSVVFPRILSADKEPALHIVAIQDIPADSELLTSYVDVTLPVLQRQKDLKETYSFNCSCHSCSPPPGQIVVDWRERMWCPNFCGGSCFIPAGDDIIRCTKCHTSSSDTGDIRDLLFAGEQALEKATSLQASDPVAALRLIQNMVPILGKRLPPSTHPLLALIRLGQSLLIAQFATETTPSTLDTAIQYAMAYVKGLSSVLRPGHPVRAVAIAELGKLLAVDEPTSSSDLPSIESVPQAGNNAPSQAATSEFDLQVPKGPVRLQRAVEVLQQAYKEICIAFGRGNEGGEAGKSVREMLVSLEKELGVWRSGIRDTLEDALTEKKGHTAPAR